MGVRYSSEHAFFLPFHWLPPLQRHKGFHLPSARASEDAPPGKSPRGIDRPTFPKPSAILLQGAGGHLHNSPLDARRGRNHIGKGPLALPSECGTRG